MVSGSCGEVLSNKIYLYVTDNVNHVDPEILVWPTLVSTDFNVALSDDRTITFRFSILLAN